MSFSSILVPIALAAYCNTFSSGDVTNQCNREAMEFAKQHSELNYSTNEGYLAFKEHFEIILDEMESAAEKPKKEETTYLPTSDDLSYFREIAFSTEYGGKHDLQRWEEDEVRIRPMGNPTEDDLAEVQKVINEINQIIEEDKFRLVDFDSIGNINIYFIPESEFSQHFEGYTGRESYGYFRYASDDSERILIGEIGINSSISNRTHRNSVIREELTQILGLGNDSTRYSDSIFYQYGNEITGYSARDIAVIKLLHSNMVKTGMSESEVINVLTNKKFAVRK
ncbi:DUF2927 domain-containing protein [Schinkia sp. CFF1]